MKIRSALFFAAATLLSNCSSSTTSSIVPDIRALVLEATPEGLQPSSRSALTRSTRTAQSVLLEFFQNTVAGISGTSGTGIVDSALKDLKFRYDEVNTRFAKSSPACASGTAVDWTVSVGAPVSQSMTLKIQCKDLFDSADASGDGSGIAWGSANGHFYLALILVQENGIDKFGYFADVEEATKKVDLLYLESFSATTTRTKFFRLLADAAETGSSTKSYQLTYSSSSESGVGTSGSNGSLGCGARLISDGTEILADGTTGQTSNDGTCTASAAFTNTDCFSAAAPSSAAAACTTLTTSSFDSKIAIVSAANTVSVNSAVLAELNFDDLSALSDI